MTKRYAVQITSPQPSGSPWKPGIYAAGSKKSAQSFVSGVNSTGGLAGLVRSCDSGWEPANRPAKKLYTAGTIEPFSMG